MYGRSNAMKGVDLGVLYGGLTASILGNLPYGCIVFGTYEAYKDVLYHKCVGARTHACTRWLLLIRIHT
jgi:hypothetical protein